MPVYLKVFHLIEEDGTPSNSLYEAIIALILQPDMDSIEKETTGQYP